MHCTTLSVSDPLPLLPGTTTSFFPPMLHDVAFISPNIYSIYIEGASFQWAALVWSKGAICGIFQSGVNSIHSFGWWNFKRFVGMESDWHLLATLGWQECITSLLVPCLWFLGLFWSRQWERPSLLIHISAKSPSRNQLIFGTRDLALKDLSLQSHRSAVPWAWRPGS